MKFWIFVFSLLSLSSVAMAKTLNYKPLSLPVEAGDHLEISGFYGKVSVSAKPGLKTVTVQLRQVNPDNVSAGMKEISEEWLFSMQKEQNSIQVHVRSPHSKAAWSQILLKSGEQPRFELNIETPSLPVEVSWHSGDLSFSGLNDELNIFTQQGDVEISNHKAPLVLAHQKGRLVLNKVEGDINIDTYSGKVTAKNIKGKVVLKNFTGSTEINNVEGQMELNTFGGSFVVTEGKGKVEYSNEKGKVNLNKFEGDVRGRSEQGALTAIMTGASHVRVSSKEGAISLRMLNSSASINAGSKEGPLNTPQYLRLTRLPNLRLVRGRLRGKSPGQVYVRTESGSIQIK